MPNRTHQDSMVFVNNKDRVIINVGGTRHECYLSTIQNFPDTRLYWIVETALKTDNFCSDNEFFFDRHPGCFQNILNYCRTGKLHCPNDVCGPMFEEELKFWGVDELMMEACCWGNYTQHREAKKTLRLFDELYEDDDEKHKTMRESEEEDDAFKNKNEIFRDKWLRKLHLIRKNIWRILERPGKTIPAQLITITIFVVILLSVTTFCLETMEQFQSKHKPLFENLEIFYCVFFTIDFVLRFVCSPSKADFVKSFFAWIDFLSTIQFYITLISSSKLFSFLFMFRLLRVFRLMHFFKSFSGILVIGQTLKSSARELMLLAMILLVPMVIFSTLIYYAEMDEGTFDSIPASFWWAIITMTTVGYGDLVPTSVYGKLLGAACAFCGILIVALPISVVGNNFNFYYSYAQARMRLPKRAYLVVVPADKGSIVMGEKNKRSRIPLKRKDSDMNDNQEDTSVEDTLEDIASVMVGVSIPSYIRRHSDNGNSIKNALQIERPIRRSLSVALSNLAVPLSIPSADPHKLLLDDKYCKTEIEIPIETSEKYQDTDNIVQTNNVSKKARKTGNYQDIDSFLQTNKASKQASTTGNYVQSNNIPMQEKHFDFNENSVEFEMEEPDDEEQLLEQPQSVETKKRTRTVLHVDISQYQPRKLSESEYKARRNFCYRWERSDQE